MIVELCGGTASKVALVTSNNWPQITASRTVRLRPERVQALAGLDLAQAEQHAILDRLGFKVAAEGVTPPAWRPDIDGEADLVEEIARLHGYDRVPATPLDRAPGVARPTATRSQIIERRIRRTAAGRGLDEAVTWSFISQAEADAFGGAPWQLANPISEDMRVMRPSLLPGLIAAARRNLDRGADTVRLFEIGRRYLEDTERPTAALLLAGHRQGRSWQQGKPRAFDPFDAKAELLALLEAAGAPVANLQVFPDAGATWHPGRSASLRLGPKTVLAAFGELHPRLGKLLDAPAGAIAAEIYLDAIPQGRDSARVRAAFMPPVLQSITRDFALIVPTELTAEALVRAVRGADKTAITAARIFDRFEAPEGLSLAVEVTLQPQEKSFTDEQIGEISRRIVAAGEKLGARLRS
jgi:phenylalanyl-tRNA synthetase beta chain